MKKLSFEEMQVVEGGFNVGSIFPNNPCEVALGMAASAWTAAIMVVNPAIGILFAMGANYAASRTCAGGGSWFN